MNDNNQQAVEADLEAWKEACRELQHCVSDIRKISKKILSFFHGEAVATVAAVEAECRDYLTALNQRHACLRRVIHDNKENPHYSHKQVMEFEKRASEMIVHAKKAWEDMLTWVPKIPAGSSGAN